MVKKRIVVLGAGFAGIACVKKLLRRFSLGMKEGWSPVEITLVDQNDYHLFQADLYEVATAYSGAKVDDAKGAGSGASSAAGQNLAEVQSAIVLPLTDLLPIQGAEPRVKFVQDEVVGIDRKKKTVKLRDGVLSYDYLVVALGSQTNYFGIPGLEKYSLNMKGLHDAVEIHNKLESLFKKVAEAERDVYVNVGGGGATGVEMAAELVGLLKRLSRKYKVPFGRVHISLIEGSKDVLAALDKAGTAVVVSRLKKLGVKLRMGRYIQKVMNGKVFLEAKGRELNVLPSDLLIWTGGVQVSKVVQKFLGSAECRGAIAVNEFLQSNVDEKIFAAGDNAFLSKEYGMFAQVAYQEGELIGENIWAAVTGESEMKNLQKMKVHYLLPLGGRYAIWQVKSGRIYRGFFIWCIRRMVFLRYALSVLPFWKAVRKLLVGTRVFVRND